MKMKTWINIVILLILIAYSIFSLSPIILAVINSGKTQGEILTNILALPSNFQISNYVTAFEKIKFVRSFFNTLLVVVIGCGGIVDRKSVVYGNSLDIGGGRII